MSVEIAAKMAGNTTTRCPIAAEAKTGKIGQNYINYEIINRLRLHNI